MFVATSPLTLNTSNSLITTSKATFQSEGVCRQECSVVRKSPSASAAFRTGLFSIVIGLTTDTTLIPDQFGCRQKTSIVELSWNYLEGVI